MPSKKSESSSFTLDLDAILFGKQINLEATKTKQEEEQQTQSSLTITGTFEDPLNPLKFVLDQFGFDQDNPNPIKIIDQLAIRELEAKATDKNFSFSVNKRLFFDTLARDKDDPKSSAPLAFSIAFGEEGILTFPKNIPVIQDSLSDPETFMIQLSRIVIATADIPNESEPDKSIRKGMQILGKVRFFSFEQDINLYLFQPAKDPKTGLVHSQSNETGHRSDSGWQVPKTTLPPASNDSTKWINIDKTLGPLSLRKIGFQFKDGKIWFLINLDFKLGGFDLSLQGFRLGFPPQLPPPVPNFGLDGIGLSFQKGSVTVAGAFLKAPNIPNYYSGFALVKTAKLSINAFGGYGELPDGKGRSIFIFASLNMPLGGPPVFFVTGLSLGFGYNTAFRIPTVDEVSSLPLLNPALFEGKQSPTEALALLNQFIYPEPDNLWFAVGVSFTSFKLIDSRALLVIDIAKEQISILGLSALVLPKTGKAFIDVRLGLVVFYKIREGIFQARAKIQDGSYLLDPNCRVFGEFAFYSWFKGPYKGDFVLTVGGYHPRFKKPAHYPDIERVGFHWQVSKQVQIGGEVYFALTPSAVMAGFRMSATYQSGALKAWFIALANFLLQWKPFHYDIEVAIKLGASYKFFKLEIGAELFVYGPPVGGYVKIDWFVISFTIHFGEKGESKPAVLDWQNFNEGFLPQPEAPEKPKQSTRRSKRLLAASPPPQDEICRANIVNGLIRTIEVGEKKIWVVRADELGLSTETAIPTFDLSFNGEQAVPAEDLPPADPLGIRPMGLKHVIASQHLVTLTFNGTHDGADDPTSPKRWRRTVASNNVPAALWGNTPVNPSVPESKTLAARIGLETLAPRTFLPSDVPVTWISNFDYLNVVKKSPLRDQTNKIDYQITQRQNTIGAISKGLVAKKSKRLQLMDAVNELYGLSGDQKIVDDLKELPKSLDAYMQSEPMMGTFQYIEKGAKAEAFQPIIIPPTPPIDPSADAEFFLQSALRQYQPGLLSDFTAIQQLMMDAATGNDKNIRFNAYDGASYQFAIVEPQKYNITYGYQTEVSDPTLVFFLNAFYQPLDCHVLTETASAVSVPDNVHQLVFLGLPPIDTQLNVCGWTADFNLPILDGVNLLGKQFLLRPLAPMRVPKTNRQLDIRQMLQRNQYLGSGGNNYSGSVDMLCYADDMKELVILCKKIDKGLSLKNAVDVSIPYFTKNDFSAEQIYPDQPIELQAIGDSKKVGNFDRLHFALPKSGLPAGWKGMCLRMEVRAAAQQKWELYGAFVLCSNTSLDDKSWLRTDLEQLSGTFNDMSGAVPNVTLDITLKN